MVHKMWSQDFRFSKMSLDYHTPEDFSRCMWQESPRVAWWWLAYRLLFCIYFTVTWFLTLLEIGRPDVPIDGKFFIYLTNWTYSLSTVMSVTALVIVMNKAREERRKDFVPDTTMVTMPKHYKMHWALQTVSYNAAICVSVIFWGAVYDPELQPLDVINISTHLLNSITMVIDFMLVANPYRLLHMYIPIFYSFIYIVFNIIYYFCGGTNRKGELAIYPIMDWTKPGRTILICLLSLCFLIMVNMTFWVLYRLKKWLKVKKEKKYQVGEKEGKENLGMEPVTV